MKKPYPLIDEHRKHFVRTPIQICKPTKSLAEIDLTIGKFVAVDVLKNGYKHLLAPVEHDNYETCLKTCEGHNNYHGWSKEEADAIISKSMKLKSVA